MGSRNVLDHGQRPDALFYLTDGYAYYDFDEPPYELVDSYTI